MTTATAQLWDQFADEVLPWVGLPELPARLRSACPKLPADRIEYWVARINSASVEVEEVAASDDVEWTNEEADGIWYDRLKAVALDYIDEVADLPRRL